MHVGAAVLCEALHETERCASAPRWFISRYFEPSKWLQARKNFTCTTAVWSMVGHVVGLGDRHGENILIDASSGDAVMIDFGCLFDKVSLGTVPGDACRRWLHGDVQRCAAGGP